MPKEKNVKPVEIKIDGFQPIIDKFNNDDEVVKFILENTYFFAPEIVSKQFLKLNEEPYYVRFSESADPDSSMKYYIKEDKGYVLKKNDGLTAKKLHQCSRCLFRGKKIEPKEPLYLNVEGRKIQIVVDYDGNKKVREEINRCTGLKVSYSEDINNVKNCVITHIWGNANDPRYFSFMWNFCITPSFAASLTDKNDNSNNTIAGNLRNKMKMIASKLYSNIQFEGDIWEGFNSPFNSECSDSLNGIQIKLITGNDGFEICTFTDGGKYERGEVHFW